MALELHFPVVLQAASQLLAFDDSAPVPGTYGLPINTRLYFYHPLDAHNAVVQFDLALGAAAGGSVVGVGDRQISITPYADYTVRLVDSADGLKLARLLGMYDDGPPLDLTYYQDNDLGALNPGGVTLQSVFPGMIGYMHSAYDLNGAPDWPAVHVVSDAGAAAQIAGDVRRFLDVSLRALPGALFSTQDLGSFAPTFSATFWQAYDPTYSAPYLLIIEDDHAYEYAIRKPLEANDARSIRENWHGHFNLELQLQKIGDWVIV